MRARWSFGATPARKSSTRRRASSGSNASAVGSWKSTPAVRPCAAARAAATNTAVWLSRPGFMGLTYTGAPLR